MSLNIQDLNFSESLTIYEAINTSSQNTIGGAAVFAFATMTGIELLFQSNSIINLLDVGTFKLIIGIDAITNENAINELISLMERYPNLEVKAYFKNTGREIFHPKFLWFEKEDNSGNLLVGSGNLTLQGFRENVEAFILNQLNEFETNNVKEKFLLWINESREFLKDLNDPVVRNQVRNNRIQVPRTRRIRIDNETIVENETQLVRNEVVAQVLVTVDYEHDEWSFSSTNQVLVAEIPKSGSRWKQVNFSKRVFENFFGAEAHAVNQEIIILRNINEEGLLQDIELRPAVSVASDNYRFELNAASGIPYPDEGSPIGVFIKITPGAFIYVLVFPNEGVYESISNYLNTNAVVRREGEKKRVISTCNEIEGIIANLPLEEFRI